MWSQLPTPSSSSCHALSPPMLQASAFLPLQVLTMQTFITSRAPEPQNWRHTCRLRNSKWLLLETSLLVPPSYIVRIHGAGTSPHLAAGGPVQTMCTKPPLIPSSFLCTSPAHTATCHPATRAQPSNSAPWPGNPSSSSIHTHVVTYKSNHSKTERAAATGWGGLSIRLLSGNLGPGSLELVLGSRQLIKGCLERTGSSGLQGTGAGCR